MLEGKNVNLRVMDRVAIYLALTSMVFLIGVWRIYNSEITGYQWRDWGAILLTGITFPFLERSLGQLLWINFIFGYFTWFGLFVLIGESLVWLKKAKR